MKAILTLVSLSVLFIAAAGCGSGGESSGPTLAEEIKRARGMQDPKSRALALLKVSEKQRQNGDLAGADGSIASATEACNEMDDAADQADVYCEIVRMYEVAKQIDKIEDLMVEISRLSRSIEDPRRRVDTVIRLARFYSYYLTNHNIAIEQLNDARQVADTIEDREGRVTAIVKIASGLHQAEATEGAKTQLDGALEEARLIEDIHGRVTVLGKIAASFENMDFAQQSNEVFSEAETLIADIKEVEGRGHALIDLALQRHDVEQKDAAKKLHAKAKAMAHEITDQQLRAGFESRVEEVGRRYFN